jgi:hypothetical protein
MDARPLSPSTLAPPRAGLLRGFWNVWYGFRRRYRVRFLEWSVPTLASALPAHRWKAIFIPTYAWRPLGRGALARIGGIVYLACAAFSIVALGWKSAGVAGGIMVALHGLATAEFLFSGKLMPAPRYRFFWFAATMVAVALAYAFVGPRLLAPVVVPMQTARGPILIDTLTDPASVTRGDTIAFRGKRWWSGNVLLRDGAYFGRVLGVAGDVVTFNETTFAVNGQTQARRLGMPRQGEVKVTERHVFLWPSDLRQEFARHQQAVEFAQKVALLPADAVIGRPYRRWFFRTQDYVVP